MVDRTPLSERQRQGVCELMHEAFVELRYLNGEQAHDLAYAFHNLPKEIIGWGNWSIEGARSRIARYQGKYKSNPGFDYVAAFDAIFESDD